MFKSFIHSILPISFTNVIWEGLGIKYLLALIKFDWDYQKLQSTESNSICLHITTHNSLKQGGGR